MDTAQNLVRLNTKQLLEKRNLTPYRIWKESKLSRGTVYALARNKGERADFHTLGAFVTVVERLSGEPVTVNDLLEISEPIPPEPEQRWLDSSAADLKAALEEIEIEEDPADVRLWIAAFEQVAKTSARRMSKQ